MKENNQIKITEDWKIKIEENYFNEGEHYYWFIRLLRDRAKEEGKESYIFFEKTLEVLKKIRSNLQQGGILKEQNVKQAQRQMMRKQVNRYYL